MPSGCTNNFPESGRGLGHVTPAIFGSTVGYASDILASCWFFFISITRPSIAAAFIYLSVVVSHSYASCSTLQGVAKK